MSCWNAFLGLLARADQAYDFGARLGFVTVLGIAVAVWTNLSYWNWHGFPRRYTAAFICTEVIAFIFAGVAIALVLKNEYFTDTR